MKRKGIRNVWKVSNGIPCECNLSCFKFIMESFNEIKHIYSQKNLLVCNCYFGFLLVCRIENIKLYLISFTKLTSSGKQ